MDTKSSFDTIGSKFRRAVYICEVCFLDLAVLKLFGDFPLGAVILRDDHYTRGVSIESMHDAGTELAESAGQLVGIEGQCVDEGSASVAPGGVDEDIGLLIEYYDVLVFVNDVEGNVLGRDFPGLWLWKCQLDSVASGELEALSDGLAVDEDGSGLDGVLQESPAEVAEAAVEILVDTAFLDGITDSQDQRF